MIKKLFPKFLFFAFLFLIFPAVSFAEISKIVFITDAQSINPSVLSGPITIQAQDSSGNVYQTPETLDIQFISTSATGKFLGSTGNPVTTYMSKNTANKTFYYKDSTEGTFTITINIRGRESGVELTASQPISISSGAVSESSNDSTASETSTSEENTTSVISSPNAKLEVVAGSDRATAPGSPIWFQATVKKNATLTDSKLNWSFGDGEVGTGFLVSHTYKYPGDYVVVLSARAGDIFSVSRLKVKVVEPSLSVKDTGEYLEVSNNGDTEVNIFNWKIEDAGKGFVFQPDTIILPHASVRFDKSLLKMKGLDNSLGISLKNYLGQEVFAAAPAPKVDLNAVSKNIENIKKEIAVVQVRAENLGLVSPASQQLAASIKAISPDVSVNEGEVATGTENVIYEAPKSESLFVKLTNLIKRVFSN
jgi:hypothetical protein